jgi:hypothetical protein
MKKVIVLAIVAIASQAVAIFAGEEVSSKQVIPPPPPPPDFFRSNEFDIGAFANTPPIPSFCGSNFTPN